jgi:hypothetical protein
MKKRNVLPKDKILQLYENNIEKGMYWVAKELGLNKNSVQTIIYKSYPPKSIPSKEMEDKLLELIKLYPYTGTKNKIKNEKI